MRRYGQTLLFDADDTLWENNVYFERAIADFISCLDHRVHTAQEVREHLNAVERRTIASHGYGLKSFRRSLIRCFEELSGGSITPDKHRRIVGFVHSIAQHEMELLPGVSSTLTQLAQRHKLLVVTKGDREEQTDKLLRSGLADHFYAIEVLSEKMPAAYTEVIARHQLLCSQTWMIGNSPRSDVNPALQAGIHAVYIPHHFTWVLEHENVEPPPPGLSLIELSHFSQLLDHF